MRVNIETVFPDKSAEGNAGGVGVFDGEAAGGADGGNQRDAGGVGFLHQLKRNTPAEEEDPIRQGKLVGEERVTEQFVERIMPPDVFEEQQWRA